MKEGGHAILSKQTLKFPLESTNMSTSLLYHAFSVRGYQQTRIEFVDAAVQFHVTPNEKLICCSNCGSDDVVLSGFKEREFRSTPIGTKPTTIVAQLPRVRCHQCGLVRQIEVGFAEPRRSYTKGWAKHALELSRKMTIKDVAQTLGVSWDVIKEIKKNFLQKHFANPSLKDVRQIAIDEICIGKGHRYVTLVMDMSAAYISAVKANLPNAAIVFDRFHVVKLMNEKLTQLRRQLFQKATAEQKDVLKGSRWLLLKNPENLDEDRNEATRLQEALSLNEPLAIAYYLKEDLRQFWNQTFTFPAQLFLWDWCERATLTGLKPLMTIAKTLRRLEDGLLNYFHHKISSGPMEGTNNKVKTVLRQSYGIRDEEYFKLTLYSLHTTKYALVG